MIHGTYYVEVSASQTQVSLCTFVYKREGQSLFRCSNCFWVNFTIIIQLTYVQAGVYVLSSAIYQNIDQHHGFIVISFF